MCFSGVFPQILPSLSLGLNTTFCWAVNSPLNKGARGLRHMSLSPSLGDIPLKGGAFSLGGVFSPQIFGVSTCFGGHTQDRRVFGGTHFLGGFVEHPKKMCSVVPRAIYMLWAQLQFHAPHDYCSFSQSVSLSVGGGSVYTHSFY